MHSRMLRVAWSSWEYQDFVSSMEKCGIMLCAGNSELGEVDIKRGILQGDSLSPLVFV